MKNINLIEIYAPVKKSFFMPSVSINKAIKAPCYFMGYISLDLYTSLLY